jgi:acyl carrier protein
MSREEGVEALARIVASKRAQVAISMEPFETRYAGYLAQERRPGDRESAPPAEPERAHPVSSPPQALTARLVYLCRDLLGEEEIQPSDKLMDVGADSIFVLQLQAEVEKEFGLRIHTAPLLGQTIEQLAAACADPAGHPTTVELVNPERLGAVAAKRKPVAPGLQGEGS